MGELIHFHCSHDISNSTSSEPLHFPIQHYDRFISQLPLQLMRACNTLFLLDDIGDPSVLLYIYGLFVLVWPRALRLGPCQEFWFPAGVQRGYQIDILRKGAFSDRFGAWDIPW